MFLFIVFISHILLASADTLRKIVAKCEPGAKVQELCEFGDKQLAEETSKVFKKEKDMKKGSASNFMLLMNCYFTFKS